MIMEPTNCENKKKTSSFQITSVTESHKLSGDIVDDSDDFDDSQQDFSELLHKMEKADLQVTEQQLLETLDQVNKRVNHIFVTESIPSPIIPSTGGNYGIEIVSTPEKESNKTVGNINQSDGSVITLTVRSEATDLSEWQKRFKIVKIIRTEPYKRGRWECMDFMDQPATQIETTKQEVSLPTTISGSSSSLKVGATEAGISVVVNLSAQIPSTNIKSSSIYSHSQVPHTTQFTTLSSSCTANTGVNTSTNNLERQHPVSSFTTTVNCHTTAFSNIGGLKTTVTNSISHSVGISTISNCTQPHVTGSIITPILSTEVHNLKPAKTATTQLSHSYNFKQNVPPSCLATHGLLQTGITTSTQTSCMPHANSNLTANSSIGSITNPSSVSFSSSFLAPPSVLNVESYPFPIATTHSLINHGVSVAPTSSSILATTIDSIKFLSVSLPSSNMTNVQNVISTSLPCHTSHLLVSNTLSPTVTRTDSKYVNQNIDMHNLSEKHMYSNTLANSSCGSIEANIPTNNLSVESYDNNAVQLAEEFESAACSSTVAIDNKIEQAMDLVKSHLMFAVREEVEILKEKISELMDKINQLEHENNFLKLHATQETLAQLPLYAGKSMQPSSSS